MALTNDPEELFHEIKAAEFFRDARLQTYDQQLARYHGPFFRDDSPHGEWYPENRYFTSIASALPAYAYLPPRFHCRTSRAGTQRDVAEAIGHYLNRWSKEINLDQVAEEVVRDCFFNWGVIVTTQEAITGEDLVDKAWLTIEEDGGKTWTRKGREKPTRRRRPKSYRISQRRWLMDPLADSSTTPRWMGHGWRRSRKALIQEALDDPDGGWDLEQLRDMDPETSAQPMGEIETLSEDRAHRPNMNRDDIYGWDIWMPEYRLKESAGPKKGFHGSWFTLSVYEARDGNQKYEWLRKPRPYYGPPWGPYSLCGLYTVGDEPYPLGLLTAMEAQITDVNRRALAIQRADVSYKRVIVYDETDVETAMKIQNTPDQFFVGIPGFDNAGIKEVQVGGSSREQHEGLAVSTERLDRIMGEDDASRGLVTGRGTATEHQNAAQARSLKSSWPRKMIQRCLLAAARTAAWYAYYDDRVVSALGPEASEALGMTEAWFEGGSFEDGSGATFFDLELSIELVSDPTTQVPEIMNAMQLVAGVAPAMLQTPFMPWKKLWRRAGEALRMPELEDIDMKLLKKMIGVEMQGLGSQPRLAGDVGNPRSGGGGRAGAPSLNGLPNAAGPPGAASPQGSPLASSSPVLNGAG